MDDVAKVEQAKQAVIAAVAEPDEDIEQIMKDVTQVTEARKLLEARQNRGLIAQFATKADAVFVICKLRNPLVWRLVKYPVPYKNTRELLLSSMFRSTVDARLKQVMKTK